MRTMDATFMMSLTCVDILICAYHFACLHHWGGIREVQPDKRPQVYIMGEPDWQDFGAIYKSASLGLICFGLDGHGRSHEEEEYRVWT